MKFEPAEKYNPSNITLKDIDVECVYKTYYSALCRYAERFVHKTLYLLYLLMYRKNEELIISKPV